jgi:hypothetical protein
VAKIIDLYFLKHTQGAGSRKIKSIQVAFNNDEWLIQLKFTGNVEVKK